MTNNVAFINIQAMVDEVEDCVSENVANLKEKSCLIKVIRVGISCDLETDDILTGKLLTDDILKDKPTDKISNMTYFNLSNSVNSIPPLIKKLYNKIP